MKDFESRVIDTLIFIGVIPQDGLFEISEKMLLEYIKVYGEIFGNKQKSGIKRNNEYKYARRLAGRTLVRLNYERGAKVTDIGAGMVYLISNVAYPDHYKVGMCLDINERLAVYQTYDPYKQFKIEKYDFVLDRRHIEKRLLSHPDVLREQGEWISRKNAIEVFEQVVNFTRLNI